MKSGLLLIDKPADITSFGVIRKVRQRLGIKKIGHSGTLDSFATGLLLLGIGDGSKALSHLIFSKKTYTARIVFGATTDTLDSTGEIVFEKEIPKLNETGLQKMANTFLGKIEQVPPLFSALKIQGKRASDRIRKGEEVELKSRNTEVFDTKILKCGTCDSPLTGEGKSTRLPYADIFLDVASGFYVRSFARDMGKLLGTSAFCLELKRESIGDFSLKDAVLPDQATENNILDIRPEHFSLPSTALTESEADDYFHGRRFAKEHVPLASATPDTCSCDSNGEVSVFLNDKWVGFGEVREGILHPKKVIQ